MSIVKSEELTALLIREIVKLIADAVILAQDDVIAAIKRCGKDIQKQNKANNTQYRVTRFDEEGRVHHTCLTPAFKVICSTDMDGDPHISVDMPLRFWQMVRGGRIEIDTGAT